jgi:hypothetical protein
MKYFHVRAAVAALLASVLVAGCGDSRTIDAPAPSLSALPVMRASAPGAPVTPNQAQLLAWAQASYPQYFGTAVTDGVYGPYAYRQYSSGNYIGVTAAGAVAVYGPVSGFSILQVGTLADFTCRVLACLTGTVAVGSPLSGAAVTIVDATGATAATATADAQGNYAAAFDPAHFSAPYVITATGDVGDASTTLVSVEPSPGTANVNVTPVTNAIAATLSSSGNPLDLSTHITAERANITVAAVANAEQAFRQMLAANMSAVGLDATTYNLVSGAFDAKADALLDNVQVDVMPDGEVRMVSSGGIAGDDFGNSATMPPPALALVLPKGTLPSAADASSLPVATVTVAASAFDGIAAAWTSCYALAASTRPTADLCHQSVTANYKNDGNDFNGDFGAALADTGNDGMQFEAPEIVRQLAADKVQLRLSAERTDGRIVSFVTVAVNGSTGWLLTGNQRDYYTYVNGFAAQRVSVNTPASTRFETGLNLFVRSDAGVSSAVVTGPGLPDAGTTLVKKSGCDYLTIVDPSLGTAPACASLYRLRALHADGTSFAPPPAIAYLFGSRTDAQIAGIQPLAMYKFVLTTNSGTITYWNRLRDRPLTIAEMSDIRNVQFDAASRQLVTSGTLYAGGPPPTLSWTVPYGAAAPYVAMFLHRAGDELLRIPLTATSVTLPCTTNTECSDANGDYVTTISSGLATTDQFQFQVIARTPFDLQVFSELAR